MPAIVRFPTVVQEALDYFSPLFMNRPEREHLGEYLTGLIVARSKSVRGIAGEFADAPDQSCLNRWLTEVGWDAAELNRQRLAWLQEEVSTRYSRRGVIAIDNVLLGHDGQLIEDVGTLWDHVDKRYLIAHDYVIANYVAESGKHYPLEYRRFVKEEQCQERNVPYRTHEQLLRELADWCVQEQIPGDFTFDSWFTCPDNLNHIHGLKRAYVGELKFNRHLLFEGRDIKAEQLAEEIRPSDRKAVGRGPQTQWYFTRTVRLPKVEHRVRILIVWNQREDSQPAKVFVTNRTAWEVRRILGVYRGRWTGCECFHRDGKQHLGMGECQVRNGQGQTRHMYLVFLSHTLLLRPLRQRPCAWALQKLMTIGEACLAVLRETLGDTINWVLDRCNRDGWSTERIKQELALP